MAYVDAAYYNDVFKGVPIPVADFPRLSERGSEAASFMSPYVAANGVSGLTADELTALKKATCTMTEHYGQIDTGAYNSESIGSYSYTASQKQAEAEKDAVNKARRFLDAVGLTYCGERRRQ
ncbi:conserved hypothetical protein [Gammaproteobacteria bacterium]